MCLKAVIEHERRFRGVFYIDASNTATADSNFVDISRLCNIQHHWESVELEEQIRITRAWLSCQKDPWILMVDNADLTGLELKKYIPTGGPGTVLITTTDEHFALCGDNFCKISSMEDVEAFNLLLRYRRPEADSGSVEMEAAKTLATRVLGGLPLAIAQAGSYIFNNHYTYTEYIEEFRDSPQVSLGADLQAEQWASRHQPIWTTFGLSLRRIQTLSDDGAAEAVELLKTLCFLHHETIHDRIFSEAWANKHGFPLISKHLPPLMRSPHRWDTPNIRAAFNILCRYSLLNPTSSAKGQYSMHSLVQTICRNSMSSEEQSQHSFYAVSLIATALAGIQTPLSWIENPSGFDLQRSMLPHIKTCVTDRALSLFQFRNGFSLETVFSMLLLFAKANSATGHHQDAKSLVERGIRVFGIYSSSERPVWIYLRLLEQLATCEAHLGRHTEALIIRQKVFTAWQSTKEEHSNTLCVAMMNVSDSLWAVGRREHALEVAQGCLSIRELSLERNDPKLHRTKRKVAEFLHGLDHRRRALIMREEVYRQAESKKICTDIEKLDFIASKAALSDSYQWDGRLLKAMELRHEVYQMRNDILGPEYPETLLAHDKLLVTKRCCTKNFREQQKLCQLWKRSVIIWTRTVGNLHPHTLEAKVNLGLQYSIVHEVNPLSMSRKMSSTFEGVISKSTIVWKTCQPICHQWQMLQAHLTRLGSTIMPSN
ncbi:pfs domain-containing protein [Colletotrichum chrysophilum]|uniref:Pfs domain-containing protein n=1 Tax=Colletotrichum chrysophilum TaxID=1836956 RepID=A0AAD9ADG5_9PEZI|nr:pfs domain-containing protein [Colletotrichum chrysophilum]